MKTVMTFDGVRYAAMSQGQRVPRPFHYRWLVPMACRTQPWTWRIVQGAALAACCALAWAYTDAWAAALIPLGLSGLTFNLRYPVLVDLPAMAFALAAAVWIADGHPPYAAVLLALLAGACKETAPVFAALYAWSPIPLVGLLAPAARHFMKAGTTDPAVPFDDEGKARQALEHPIKAAWASHRERGRDVVVWLAPWGVLLVGLGTMTWQAAACVAVAYGQCLVATDRVRLYQWAWPVLAFATFDAIPRAWWGVAVLVHLANPVKTEGL